MARLLRILAASAGWLGIALQYWVMTRSAGGGLLSATVDFFSYFTILSNILCAACLTFPKLAANATLRAAAALYIGVTLAIYALILKDLWQPKGLHWVADALLHYVTPTLYLLDWLLFAPKGKLATPSALKWLAYPLAYGLWTLVHGHLSGFWPYPFLDVGRHGLSTVLVNMGKMTGLFLVGGLILVLVDNVLGGFGRRR